MNYIININGYQLKLDENVDFERIIQRNTIGNLANRQSTFTSTIKVYKTGKNYKFFEFLDMPGVETDLPYVVLNAEILNESGIVVNKKGRAFIENTKSDYFYINIYDGYIDFLKKIENKTLNDLNLESLNHDKSIDTVINSWNDNKEYIYLLSDFNGNNLHNVKLNIDYQLPAGSIKYIWNKIFEFTGYSYNTNGVFNTANFEDLYISYPKPITSDVSVIPVLEQQNNLQYILPVNALDVLNLPYDITHPWLLPTFVDNEYFLNKPKTGPEIENSNQRPASNVGDYLFPPTGMFKKDGIYRLSISGIVQIQPDTSQLVLKPAGNVYYKVLDIDYNTLQSGTINSQNPDNNSIDLIVQQGNFLSLYVLNKDGETDNDLQDQTTSTFDFRLHNRGGDSAFASGSYITTKLEFLDSQSVSFANAFGKIKIRDFIKDIMFRFGLTPYPDEKNNHINFLLQESIFLNNTVDYSKNFVKEEETRFAYDNYAQKNYFRYKYNDKEAKHSDGSLDIRNENLEFEKDFYESFFYSPDKGVSNILGKEFIKSKAWNRNIDEDSNVEYEELDGRYYIFKKEKVNKNIAISSKKLGTSSSSAYYYKASFSQQDFQNILDSDYYRFTDNIIKRAKIRSVILNLTELEFLKVSLKYKIFLKQYSKEFLINRIKDKSGKNDYLFELIEINKIIKVKPNQPPTIILTGGDIAITEGEQYNEPGFAATDEEDNDLTSQVIVNNNIDNNTPGTYTITYSVTDSGGLSDSKTRTVYVNAAQGPNQAPVITLGGGSIVIGIGESFTEPGFAASDNEDGNITNQVQVNDNIDNQTPGEYQVTYTVTDSGGLTDKMTRTVIVEGNCDTFTITNNSDAPNNWVQIKFEQCDGTLSNPRRIDRGQSTTIETKKESSIFIDMTDPYVSSLNYEQEGISIQIT